jgi:hypothetical protein
MRVTSVIGILAFSSALCGALYGLEGANSAPAQQGAVSLSPSRLAFGRVVGGRTSAPHTATVTNSGTNSLYVNSAVVGGNNAGDFQIRKDSCTGATVEPGKSCIVSIVFSPATRGDRSAKLVLTNSALDSPQSIALSGTGINSVDVPPF